MKLIDKLRTIFKNRNLIAQGFYFRYFGRNGWVESVADARMSICSKCPHIDNTGNECLVPGTQPCCSKCGCSLKLKLYSLSSSCGDEKNPRWRAVMTEEQEDKFNQEKK
jgi:hypothetical protein